MGLIRLIWRSTGIGRTIDTVKNIVDEGGMIKGLKKTTREDLLEDLPITKIVYKVGLEEGTHEGYKDASQEYEKKLLEQAEEFLKQKKIYENEREEYELLMDDYEKEIEKLSNKLHRNENENRYLQQLLINERELKMMKKH